MNKQEIKIKFVKTWPEDEIVELYKAGGWWKNHYDKSEINNLIKNSYTFAVAVDKNNEAIGMGRVLSDGLSDAYLQDIVILKKYRGQGIGKLLVKKMIDHCKSNKIHWIALISEPDQDAFYSKIGFKTMKNYIPMKFQTED